MSKERANSKVRSAKVEEQLAKCEVRRSKGVKLYVTCFVLLALSSLLLAVFAYAQGDLKTKIPDLCYQCHIKLKESLSLSYIHFPFKQGMCSDCHNPHTSNLKYLIKDEINSLCLRCHEGIKKTLKKENVHTALRRGVCTDCHYAHSGGNKHLLVKAQKDLCWGCHEPLKEQLKRPYTHLSFKEGKCSSCHNPHASSEENQLLAAPNKICKSCHAPRCKAGGVSIAFATERLNCITCHSGHSSNTSGLFGPYGHTAFLEKRCEQCHELIVTNRKIATRLPGKDLCFSCHKKDPAKLREPDVHVNDTKGGCGMCHNYHASRKKNLTVKESRLCFTCHENTEKSTALMEKALRARPIRCIPVKDRKCFECHIPPHSNNPLYLRADKILTCARCHKAMHEVTHPIGNEVIDPRNGQPITCITCHSMHTAKAEFMLYFDRKRTLCIQCHKR
ncbi:MAG: cytochrome c3 family protein [Nitrospirota bacterium]